MRKVDEGPHPRRQNLFGGLLRGEQAANHVLIIKEIDDPFIFAKNPHVPMELAFFILWQFFHKEGVQADSEAVAGELGQRLLPDPFLLQNPFP